jgi:hypothetical protein
MIEHFKFTGCDKAVATGSLNVGNGRIDNGGFRWTADLRKIGQECGKVEETAV